MAEIVYVLCALTSAACAVLLWRAWSRSRARLLLWSAVCFTLLTVNNVLLFVDLVVVQDVDLSEVRTGTGLAGLLVLLYGLVYDRQPGSGT
jgi:Family of unknown function (DUF5985)